MKKSWNKVFKLLILLIFSAVGVVFYNAQEKKVKGFSVAFYNVENLMDTIDNKQADDNDFLPSGKLKWNTRRYRQKLDNLSKVIEHLGDENGPEILGLCEVENDEVIYDLIYMPAIQNRNYHFIHKDSKDKRGIDVALLYKKDIFKPFVTQSHEVYYGDNTSTSTRSILLVGGVLHKDSIYILVNHWPSRRMGQEESEHKRMAASAKLLSIYDSLLHVNNEIKVIVMGDFNDEPNNKSILNLMKGNGVNTVINPFEDLKKEGEGTVKFKSKWELFDQILISNSLSKSVEHSYIKKSATIFHPQWLHYREDYKNGPFRTFSGTKYHGGYSDHFPVYIHLKE